MSKTHMVWGETSRVYFSLGGPARLVYALFTRPSDYLRAWNGLPKSVVAILNHLDKGRREITANHTDLVHRKSLECLVFFSASKINIIISFQEIRSFEKYISFWIF